ncbi:MAG: GDSL-type esterase/lipase family protein [Actinomycetes bacterium]
MTTTTRSADGSGAPRGPERARPPAVLVLLLLAAVGVVVRAALRVRRLAREAPSHRVPLDHARRVVAAGADPDAAPLRLLVVGDSAADGYGLTDLDDAFPGQAAVRLSALRGRPVEVASVAVDGARTRDVLVRQVPAVAASRPDLVVVGVGVNEALRGARAGGVRADTAALLDALADLGPQVALVPCPDLAAAPGLPWPVSSLAGWRCRAVRRAQTAAGAAAGVAVVRYPGRPPAAMFGPDGLHPGPLGAAASAALLVAALEDKDPPWTSD